MEAVGAISEGEWNTSFNGMCSEEADFMAQLLGTCLLPNEVPSGPNLAASSPFWTANESNVNILGVDESAMYSSDETNTSMFSFSLGSSYSGGNSFVFPSSSHERYYPFVNNHNLMTTMDYCVLDGKNNSQGGGFLNQDVSNDSIDSDEKLSEDARRRKNLHLGTEKETPVSEPLKEGRASSRLEMSKKRLRIPGGLQRSKKLKKCAKVDDNNGDNNNNNNNNTNAVLHRQSSSGCFSEDESNASHELNGVTSSSSSKGSAALNSNGKTRAGKGSATDPQSLYARKRREKINERLRILQNLVPNGTKVDISTMLEEAVQYVKFLLLQIKLLSSDELWMYAPIAYNGMNIGLDFMIPTPKPQS